MHKKINITKLGLISVMLLSFAFTGCQTFCGLPSDDDSYKSQTIQPKGIESPPASSSAPSFSSNYVSDKMVSYEDHLIRIEKDLIDAPGIVGAEYTYSILATAKQDLKGAMLEQWLSDNLTYVSSNPAGQVEANTISWELPPMSEGETKEIQVTVIPQNEGDFNVCSTVSAEPSICLPLYAGNPKLAISKEGPSQAELGDNVIWNIVVTNVGTAVAKDVVVNDTLPSEFSPISSTSQSLGDLRPNESKTFEVTATVNQTGSFKNLAQASFAGGIGTVEDTMDMVVIQSKVSIDKTGPEKEYVYNPADYQITVSNIGGTTLQNLVVTEELPSNSSVINAGTGTLGEGKITWTIPSLAAEESRSFDFTLTSDRPGSRTDTATVTTERGLRESDSLETQWLAAPAVQTSILDDKDPIRVGEETTYTVKITNQGDFDSVGADIKVTLSSNLQAVSTSGTTEGEINGNVITFPQATIQPRKDLILKIVAKAIQAGSAKARVELNTGFLSEPTMSEEPTNIY